MGEEQKIFSDVQRNVIYNEMLKPIKVRISEILLYDTEASMKFLQKYNEILKSTNEQDILSEIAELEMEIGIYEKNDGLQKSFEDKSQSIIQQIKDMQRDGDMLSLEDFESEFNELKQTYQTTFSKYSFQAREAIEQQLYELYGKVMLRRVREDSIDGVEVPKEDVNGLTIFMNGEIDKLSQNSNPQVQNAIERIKFKLMDKEDAFQGDEIWRLLNYAQSQKFIEPNQATREPNQPQVTALAVVKEKKGKGLVNRVKKAFQREPQLPLQVEDLSKITLDWLARHIPEDMLRKRFQVGENEYLPDPKTAIYNIITYRTTYSRDTDTEMRRFNNNGGFVFEDESGNKATLCVYGTYMQLFTEDWRYAIKAISTFDDTSWNLFRYTAFIDEIFGTDFANNLAVDFAEFILNPKSTLLTKLMDSLGYYDVCALRDSEYYASRDLAAQSRLFKNLAKSFNSISKECEETETDFRAKEEANRRAFNKKHQFKERIKQIPDNQSSRTTHENTQQSTKRIIKVKIRRKRARIRRDRARIKLQI